MKRIGMVLLLSLLVAGGAAFAQSNVDFAALQSDFTQFATDVSSSLPTAATMGLNWSSAYVGQLPHFGVGVAAGFMSVPITGIDQIGSDLGIGSLSEALQQNLGQYSGLVGMPIPAAVVEARLGGILLPFDVGIKAGFIPAEEQAALQAELPAGMNVNFHLYGASVRFPLTKETFLMPHISIGAAVNHFDGQLIIPGSASGLSSVEIASFTTPDGQTQNLELTSPDVQFNWASNSIDANIEISKTILYIVTPYIGLGASYGVSTAGGGVTSQLLDNGSPITPDQISQIEQFYGQTLNLSDTGFTVTAPASGLSARVYGGLSLNLLILKLDVTGIYNLSTGLVGVTVGTRIQI